LQPVKLKLACGGVVLLVVRAHERILGVIALG